MKQESYGSHITILAVGIGVMLAVGFLLNVVMPGIGP